MSSIKGIKPPSKAHEKLNLNYDKVKPLKLNDLFKDYKGEHQSKELDTGKPVGKEIW